MARPHKLTLDFFVHDARASEDHKIKKLENKFKLEGYAVYFKLLERLCQNEGMKLDLSDSEDLDLIAKEFKLRDSTHFTTIINYCAQISLFDKQLWESDRVVFSHGLHNRYLERLEARKAAAIRKQRSLDAKKLQDRINVFTGNSQDVTRDNLEKLRDNVVNSSPELTELSEQPEHSELIQNASSENDPNGGVFISEKKLTRDEAWEQEFTEQFYQRYPKKENKPNALRTFKAKRKAGHSLEDILARLDYDMRDWRQKKTEVQFIPNPQAWLNKENWLAEGWRSPAQVAKSGAYPFSITPQQIRAWLKLMAEYGETVEFLEHVNPDNPDPKDRPPQEWGVDIGGVMTRLGPAMRTYTREYLEMQREDKAERDRKRLEKLIR